MRSPLPVLILGLTACAASPGPPPLAMEVELTCYAGNLFEGPQPGRSAVVQDDPREARVLSYDAFYVQELPASELEPVARRTRLVFNSPHRHLLASTTILARGAHLAAGKSARELRDALRAAPPARGETRLLGTAALPLGSTTTVSVAPPVAGDLTLLRFVIAPGDGSAPPAVGVHVSGEMLTWSRVNATELTDDRRTYASHTELRHEFLVLDERVDTDAGPIAFVMQNEKGAPGTMVLIVEVLPPPAPGDESWTAHAERFAESIERIERVGRRSDRAARPLRDARRATDVLADAAAGLDNPDSMRAALAHLASSTGAGFAADLALVGERQLLEEIVESAESHVAESDARPIDYGWALERGAVLACAARLKSSELGPDELALLALHLGEAAYYPGRLEEAARASEGRAAFLDRIAALHVEFLDTSNPATRLNAYDWLRAQGRDVPGYDPIEGVRERRAALSAYYDAAEGR